MIKQEFTEGVLFKIRDGFYTLRYEIISGCDLVRCIAFQPKPCAASATIKRVATNINVKSTGIQFYDVIGDVILYSDLLKYSDLKIVDPTSINPFAKEHAAFTRFPAWVDEDSGPIAEEKLKAIRDAYDGHGHKRSDKSDNP